MDEATARPFDAAVSLMAEAPNSPPSEWSTVSLVKFARDAIFTPPSQRSQPSQARERITEALKALAGRGLDGYALVRYGLGPKLAEQIAALASLPQFFQIVTQGETNKKFTEILKSLPQEVSDWSQLCEADIEPRKNQHRISSNPEGLLLNAVMELTHDWHLQVRAWSQQADVNDLIDWNCPSLSEFSRLVDCEIFDADLESHYAWVADRLTETYLSDWDEASLHHEYRRLKANAPALFPDEIMALRPISSADLNAEIAERAVTGNRDSVQRETIAQLAIQGAQLIKAGNRAAAASTFRLIIKIAPENSQARNDLGFSLIPDEPRKALRHLATAARMGYDQPFINAHNRMLCNLLIGTPKEALSIAESIWESSMTKRPVPALLWSLEKEGNWGVQSVSDARAAVAELAVQAARTLDAEIQEVWQGRLSTVSGPEGHADAA